MSHQQGLLPLTSSVHISQLLDTECVPAPGTVLPWPLHISKQTKLELQLVKHPFWHRKATKGRWESEMMALCSPYYWTVPSVPFSSVGAAGCVPSLWGHGQVMFLRLKGQMKEAELRCCLPFTDAIFRLFFLCPARSVHKICWNFLFCHLLPLHY